MPWVLLHRGISYRNIISTVLGFLSPGALIYNPQKTSICWCGFQMSQVPHLVPPFLSSSSKPFHQIILHDGQPRGKFVRVQ